MRERSESVYFVLAAMILTAMAAGMGLGIRGQYGHESGAMIAGTLASLTLVLLFGARGIVAHGGTGCGHDDRCDRHRRIDDLRPDRGAYPRYRIGRQREALRWGMLGLFVKGGLWIGFGGAFLGNGTGGGRQRYHPLEMALVMAR